MGQAKSDSLEAQNQVEKAMKEVKAIKDELENLRDINVSDLDALGKFEFQLSIYIYTHSIMQFTESRLAAAEEEVRRANLNSRLESLVDIKNNQIKYIKDYEDDISTLEAEVNNIKMISEALPAGCFKRTRLEP